MEINNKYVTLINTACENVKRFKRINVALSSIEFCGIHKYSHENVYKINLMIDNGFLTIYQEEESFKYWADVPWSGLEEFKPVDFDSWPEDRKLMLAWCWAIYRYCKNPGSCQNMTPPAIEK